MREYTPDTDWIRIMAGNAMATATDRKLPVEEARQEGHEWFDRWYAAEAEATKAAAFRLTPIEWEQKREQVAQAIDPRASELHASDSLPNDHFSAQTLVRHSLERADAAMRVMGLKKAEE